MAREHVLGLSAFYHDSAAALLADDEILAAAQEERFSRKKGDADFPEQAVRFCLGRAGIGPGDLAAVVFYDKPIVKFDRVLSSYVHRAPWGFPSFFKAIPLWLRSKLWTEDQIRKHLKGFEGRIFFTDHHQSHAASAFYPSPFAEAAVLTVDGAGEWTTGTLGHGKGRELTLLKKLEFPHSLGLLYSAFTYYCGFRVNFGEYKLMGLAPYGTPRFKNLIYENLVEVFEDGSLLLNERYFNYVSGLRMISRRFETLFGRPPRDPESNPDPFYMDVAASIQEVTEEIMLRMASEAHRLTGSPNLVLAGGVALNCVANGRIVREGPFENLWIQPAAGDAGGALGAALYYRHAYREHPREATGLDRMKGGYLGPSYGAEEIEAVLKDFGARYEIPASEDDLLKKVLTALREEKVVGWFDGAMEFGPRALGGRSILGDARSTTMQRTMNLKIKFRESFRPFAPAVLEDRVNEVFEQGGPSPYMLLVADVKKELQYPMDGTRQGLDLLEQKRSPYPAITHVDYSARLQTVNGEYNPRFHRLLKKFEEVTGSPMLINTSFNVRGEPIVCSPADAYRCFMATEMDVLVLGDYYLEKETQDGQVDLSSWRDSLVLD